MATGEVFDERFGGILKLERIAEWLIKLAEEQVAEKGEAASSPRETIERFIEQNSEKIADSKSQFAPDGGVGFRGDGNVYILRSVFDEQFKDGLKGFKKSLQDDGIMIKCTSTKRYIGTFNIDKISYERYVIRLGKEAR